MTPAIALLRREGVLFTEHSYVPDSAANSFGEDAAAKLGVSPQQMFKTLVCSVDERLHLVLVPVAARLNLKALTGALDATSADLADPRVAERVTGYVVGGISPLGGRRQLPTFIDSSIQNYQTVFVSGGRRGLQLELAPNDLIRLTDAGLLSLIG